MQTCRPRFEYIPKSYNIQNGKFLSFLRREIYFYPHAFSQDILAVFVLSRTCGDKVTKILRNLCLHFARQDVQDGKKWERKSRN